MEAKDIVKKGYECFGKGDMEGLMSLIHDDIEWTFPGKEGVHPLSGVHKGKENYEKALSKIPGIWSNFHVKPDWMISEGNKVFVKVDASADGMENTIFGHYHEVQDGKLIKFITFDDTLSMANAMKK